MLAPPPLPLTTLLAGAHCARLLRQDGFGGGILLLDAVRAVLALPTHKVCYAALEALPELMQQGEGVSGGGGQGLPWLEQPINFTRRQTLPHIC